MKYSFIILLFLIVSCAKNYEKKFSEIEEMTNQKNYTQAVEILKEIANSDDQKYSPLALSKLGIIYQQNNISEIRFNESQSIAQKYFYQVYQKYPESSEAAKSLFMSAYLLANELKNFDEATKQYILFIEKYPDNELVTSAKIELENIGLSPEEILKKKISDSNANQHF
jgi:tetratricopeptide (TPR) repeat protein